ncbi:MAG: hypothetical protein N2559_06490 [Anaerolineae bacterium]|nr:hypothetical protein [Anaerolineae bacterium]
MSKNTNLRSRATTAIITYAIFRWESAATIALTILLAYFVPRPFEWWQWWYWLIIGGVAEIAIIITSIQDANTGARVVAEMLREEFTPQPSRHRNCARRYNAPSIIARASKN